MIIKLINKYLIGGLYRKLPNRDFKNVVKRTSSFDIIGPIKIPINEKPVRYIYAYTIVFYKSKNQHLLITSNKDLDFRTPTIRFSSNCIFGFILNSIRCDCNWELDYSIQKVLKHEDSLILIGLDQHGKSIPFGFQGHSLIYALGQFQKLELVKDAYEKNNFKNDYRTLKEEIEILKFLKIKECNLLTNNPARIKKLQESGIIVNRLPIEKPYSKFDSEELGVKKMKLGHMLELNGFSEDDIEIYNINKETFKKSD